MYLESMLIGILSVAGQWLHILIKLYSGRTLAVILLATRSSIDNSLLVHQKVYLSCKYKNITPI